MILQGGEISTPPAYGAKIVAAVLGDDDLRKEWKADLIAMTSRLKGMRQAVYEELTKLSTPGNWEHLKSQVRPNQFVSSSFKAGRSRTKFIVCPGWNVLILRLNQGSGRCIKA
jgi:aspartate/tyrosine/aromatic aminotransferase